MNPNKLNTLLLTATIIGTLLSFICMFITERWYISAIMFLSFAIGFFVAMDRRDSLKEENACLREALKFYADEETYELTGEKNYIGHGDYEESTWFEIELDKGNKARQALERESK